MINGTLRLLREVDSAAAQEADAFLSLIPARYFLIGQKGRRGNFARRAHYIFVSGGSPTCTVFIRAFLEKSYFPHADELRIAALGTSLKRGGTLGQVIRTPLELPYHRHTFALYTVSQ